jgi:DNA-binding IclR family transcriptional regulator
MEALAEAHGETAILTAPGGTHAMCLASIESDRHAMRLSYDRWRTAPMHLGASGKVLLAHLDDAHAERILAAPPPHPSGGAQIGEATLRAQIDATRRDGYLVTDGELDRGATAIAAPILDARGRPVAGLSVAGPTERVRGALNAIVPAVVAGAQAIAGEIAAP